jgi:hypothetical protein
MFAPEAFSLGYHFLSPSTAYQTIEVINKLKKKACFCFQESKSNLYCGVGEKLN